MNKLLVGFFFACVLCFFVGIVDGIISRNNYVKTNIIELVSLSNSITQEGSLFLGTGSVEGELIYSYCYRSNGGIQMSHIPAEKTTIFEEDVTQPRIEVYSLKGKIFGMVNDTPSKYHVYIPNGSIWQGYDVDVRRN